ncbi:MAG: hypothetical protein HY561_01555 [Gemmatimonadetes bacterium]|nr:hypothetical protein [Gemmatimonadota bacterium]
MAQRVFFVSSTGRVTYGGRYAGASRSVGMVVRTLNLGLQTDMAVQIYGGLEVGGNATVTGMDEYPSNWANCPAASGSQKAVVAKDTSLVYTRGGGQIVGNPAETQDTSLNAQDFLQYGDVSFDELKALAEKVYPAGVTVNNTAPALTQDGRCDKSVRENWGAPTDPTSPCHFYFPIIYAQGNLTISSSSSGQGILLVEGDLKIAGGFQFNGLVIVKGTFETGSGNAQVNGSVIVYSGGSLGVSTISDLTGTPIVSLGTCAIKRAEEYNTAVSRAIPLSTRAWIDLSGAGTSSN